MNDKTVRVEKDDEEVSEEANKENIDPNHNHGGTNFWTVPGYFEWLERFAFGFLQRRTQTRFWVFNWHGFGLHWFCNAPTENHYHVLAQCFGDSQ